MMRKNVIKSLVLVCILSAIFSLSGFNYALAYEKEIKNLSTTMAEDIAKAGKKTIAVVDFTDLQGNVTELGRFIAEEFSVVLAGSGKGFEVVDRIHLMTILQEHKLAMTGIIDPSTARKLGKIAGVEALVTGTITPFGESVRLSVKILETETAKIIGASSGDIPKTKAIEELLERGIYSVPLGVIPIVPSHTKPRQNAKQTVEAQKFTFELTKCEISGESIICDFVITNNDQDREFTLNTRGSRIFDDSGNEYRASQAYLANKRGSSPQTLLLSNIPTNASLYFENVSTDARSIALLELGCAAMNPPWTSFKLQFRNIPISK